MSGCLVTKGGHRECVQSARVRIGTGRAALGKDEAETMIHVPSPPSAQLSHRLQRKREAENDQTLRAGTLGTCRHLSP